MTLFITVWDKHIDFGRVWRAWISPYRELQQVLEMAVTSEESFVNVIIFSVEYATVF